MSKIRDFEERYVRPHFSCRVYKPYLTYISHEFPHLDLAKIVHECGLTLDYIENESNWASTIFDTKFTKAIIKHTGDENIAYNAGVFFIEGNGLFLIKKAVRLLSLNQVYIRLGGFLSHFSRVTRVEIISSRQNHIEIKVLPVAEHLDAESRNALRENFENILQNTVGYLTAVPRLHDRPPAHLKIKRVSTSEGFDIVNLHIEFESASLMERGGTLIPFFIVAFTMTICFWSSNWQFSPIVFGAIATNILWIMTYRSKILDLASTVDKTFRALSSLDQRFMDLQQAEQALRRSAKAGSLFVPWRALQTLGVNELADIKFGQSAQRVIAALVLDIRGFSRLAEKMSPTELTALLNDFFAYVAPEIDSHGGFINAFTGDGFLGIFPESGQGSIEAGFAILEKTNIFNLSRMSRGLEPLKVGIGIAKGHAHIGTVGFKDQMQVSVTADAVNTAAKLEKINKELDTLMLVDSSLLDASKNPKFRSLGSIAIPEKANKLPVDAIFDWSYVGLPTWTPDEETITKKIKKLTK